MEINKDLIPPFNEKDIIGHIKSYDHYMSAAHFHDGYEIDLTLTDGTVYDIDGKSYTAKSGTVTIFAENEIHRTSVPANVLYDRYNIHFKPRFIQDMSYSCPGLTDLFISRPDGFENCVLLDNAQKDTFIGLLEKMLGCQQGENINNREFKLKLFLCEILLYINDVYAANNKLVVRNYTYTEQILAITEHIKNNLTGDLRIETLVDKFYISKSYINNIFKKSFGITPNDYIVYCRLMKAKDCLRRGMQIKKVCELSGYDNSSSFIRAFKKIIGCTPKDYQKKMAETPPAAAYLP
ncbi:MAG: AraC family transcriptional regulator [Oscillospiraceae bacterium]|nr:AraC family transcriptional regulator [Oscillospiraceae bacterium]